MNKYLRYLINFGVILFFFALLLSVLTFPILSKFNAIIAYILLSLGAYVYAEGAENYIRKINKKLKYYKHEIKIGDSVLAYRHKFDSTIVKIGVVENIYVNEETGEKSYLISGETYKDVTFYSGDEKLRFNDLKIE